MRPPARRRNDGSGATSQDIRAAASSRTGLLLLLQRRCVAPDRALQRPRCVRRLAAGTMAPARPRKTSAPPHPRALASVYSYNVGAWHLIALSSDLDASAGSPQERWLRRDLARHPRRCILAYWH